VIVIAVCPECGNGTFNKAFDGVQDGFECLLCGEYLFPEDLILKTESKRYIKGQQP